MRNFSFIHTVFASLLWCAAVFVFVGVNFVKYEATSRMLRQTRIEGRLLELHRMLQVEMDKGYSLPELKSAEKQLLQFGREETDFSTVSVFDARNGKILFSSLPSLSGQTVSEQWRKKCVSPDTVFYETEKNRDAFGVPLFNAMGENTGCLIAEYSTELDEAVREKMIKTAFRYIFRLAGTGMSLCGLLFLFGFLKKSIFVDKKIRLISFFTIGLGTLLLLLFFNFSTMFKAFEYDFKDTLVTKARVIAGQIAECLEKTIQNGVPFDSMTSLETYMDQIRQKNKEILFILVTDKTGRVLYEAGNASEAFEADARTGKVSLKEGCGNAAEPVNKAGVSVGWVQVGVNERFVHEKIF